jgi:hypothetical protein
MAWCRLAAPPALERVGAWAKELGARREFCQRCKHPLAELLPLQHGGRVEASQEVRQPVAAAFDQSVRATPPLLRAPSAGGVDAVYGVDG